MEEHPEQQNTGAGPPRTDGGRCAFVPSQTQRLMIPLCSPGRKSPCRRADPSRKEFFVNLVAENIFNCYFVLGTGGKRNPETEPVNCGDFLAAD